MREFCALLFLAATAPMCAQEAPIVSSLHTVSIHVDSPESFNALLRFFGEHLQWPVIYGRPWTADRGSRRSYAGIWAGNVVLEICGPYTAETFEGGVRARLHGLTFRPHQTTNESIVGLDSIGILHKAPFDSAGGNLRFVVLDDSALTSSTLSVSIMEVRDGNREKDEQDTARVALAANLGGPIGLKSVQEIHVAYRDATGLAKWRQLLTRPQIDTGGSPGFRLVEGEHGAITALVVRVASAAKATAFLKAIESETTLLSGVRILCIE